MILAEKLPLVSVCIGSYNRDKYIRETLESVFAQTYRNIEVIVVDDASTDGTVRVIREFGDRVKLIIREKNSGMCPVTRNQACRAATGKYVALLDSDDAWYPTKVERQVEFLEAHSDVPLCHTYCHVIDEESHVLGIRHEKNLPPTGDYFRPLLQHCWITISSVMMRRSLIDEIGPFNEGEPYGRLGEDMEFFLRVARKYPIGIAAESEVLARYRVSAAGITHGNWRARPKPVPLMRALVDRDDIWRGQVTRREMCRAFEAMALENCVHWRDRGFADRALYFAWAAWKLSPVSPRVWGQLARSITKRITGSGASAVTST